MNVYRLSSITRYFPGLPQASSIVRELGQRTHRVVESAVVHAVVGDDVPVLFWKEEKKEDATAHDEKRELRAIPQTVVLSLTFNHSLTFFWKK